MAFEVLSTATETLLGRPARKRDATSRAAPAVSVGSGGGAGGGGDGGGALGVEGGPASRLHVGPVFLLELPSP